jgi:hypothetical protein
MQKQLEFRTHFLTDTEYEAIHMSCCRLNRVLMLLKLWPQLAVVHVAKVIHANPSLAFSGCLRTTLFFVVPRITVAKLSTGRTITRKEMDN